MTRLNKHSKASKQPQDAKSDMTPMLDIVFILLLFFIVTTSFIQADGIKIPRPTNNCTQDCNSDSLPLIVTIDATNQVSFNNRIIDLEAIQANLESQLVNDINAPVIVKVHGDSHNHAMVSAVDQANRAGVASVSVSKW